MSGLAVDRDAAPQGGFFRTRVHALLGTLRGCELTLVERGARTRYACEPGDTPLRATLHVHDAATYRAMALGGSVGAGEAYVDGLWDCDDLVALVRILVANRDVLDRLDTGLAAVAGALLRASAALRRNTRAGSRRNIAAHYDLGNALFERFLDANLLYSSAIYADDGESLEAAQFRKVDRICRKLELAPSDHVVEIGTGWGGFALHAAAHYGCRVTTTTLSREQHALASKRVQDAGLGYRIAVRLDDYRDLDGTYDKLVSIEMIEAIGAEYLDTYFAKCASLLAPHGMALVQAITIEDRRYAQALKSVDFIKRHVFPGSFMPAIAPMTAALAKTDLRLFHLEDIGPSYARTLAEWRARFCANEPAIRALGYDTRFVRLWRYYLAYCEGAFLERAIGDVQMLLVKPGCRRASYLPDLAP